MLKKDKTLILAQPKLGFLYSLNRGVLLLTPVLGLLLINVKNFLTVFIGSQNFDIFQRFYIYR